MTVAHAYDISVYEFPLMPYLLPFVKPAASRKGAWQKKRDSEARKGVSSSLSLSLSLSLFLGPL